MFFFRGLIFHKSKILTNKPLLIFRLCHSCQFEMCRNPQIGNFAKKPQDSENTRCIEIFTTTLKQKSPKRKMFEKHHLPKLIYKKFQNSPKNLKFLSKIANDFKNFQSLWINSQDHQLTCTLMLSFLFFLAMQAWLKAVIQQSSLYLKNF